MQQPVTNFKLVKETENEPANAQMSDPLALNIESLSQTSLLAGSQLSNTGFEVEIKSEVKNVPTLMSENLTAIVEEED